MRNILLIAKRDYLAAVRSKAFVIGLVVAPLIFGGGFIAMALVRGKSDGKVRAIAVVDHTRVASAPIAEALARSEGDKTSDFGPGAGLRPKFELSSIDPDPAAPDMQRLSLSDRVRSGALYAFLEISADGEGKVGSGAVRVNYYSKPNAIDDARRWLSGPINDGLRRVRLAQVGMDESQLDRVLSPAVLQRRGLLTKDPKTGAIVEATKTGDASTFAIPFSVMMLMGMIVMTGATPMLTGIAEDKVQRVHEMLLGAVTPFQLMAGKVVGAIAVSLTSASFYIVGGTLMLNGLGMMGMVSITLLPWFYLYLVLEITMLCALAAALGAACSSPQDAQNLNLLLLSPVLIPFFTSVPMLMSSDTGLATVMSLIPPFVPMLMLLRQALPGGVPIWQPWVGLVGALGWTLAMVWLAGRIFRIGILMQGKTPPPAEILRWAFRR
ncbi:ABC transporter permease [uncultured Paludibaculum sp.]|uniref:ABC transporter permease n=1 Tax=uncultured Paludibaculum sp. TaxID=1765020 RepID=UPI002AAB2555|nr:ABC transporter permease [uncultured Paludibaculum sp.]